MRIGVTATSEKSNCTSFSRHAFKACGDCDKCKRETPRGMQMNRHQEINEALSRAIAIHGNVTDYPQSALPILEHVNASIKNAHGVEAIYQGNDKPSCMYVNTGDTYNATLLYDDRLNKFLVTSWGDWMEEQELNGYKYN